MSRNRIAALALSAAFAGAALAGPAFALEPKQCLPMAAMNDALRAEGQRTMIIGDRIVLDNPTGHVEDAHVRRYVNTVTANTDGSLGYQLEGDLPRSQPSTDVCVRAKLTNVHFYDATRPGIWRQTGINGGIEATMREGDAMGSRPMVVADTIHRGADGGEQLGLKMILSGNIPERAGVMYARNPDGHASTLMNLGALEYTQAGRERAVGAAQVASLRP